MDSTSIGREELENKMFFHIIEKGTVVKSQQRDEKDLTQEEKIGFLRETFKKNKSSFLFRFGRYLSISDLQNFEDDNENSDCKYYINKLKEELNPKIIEARVKNRRFNYLKRTLRNTSYFSDEEMKYRCPLLYQQYIEQYKTEEDLLKEKEKDLAQNTLSQFLLGTVDKKIYEARCRIEEEQLEEFDSADESDEDDKIVEFDKYMNKDTAKLPDEEKERFRCEFVSLMEERFLSGEDKDFDYEKVDKCEQYDDIYDQDIEDSYFDEV